MGNCKPTVTPVAPKPVKHGHLDMNGKFDLLVNILCCIKKGLADLASALNPNGNGDGCNPAPTTPTTPLVTNYCGSDSVKIGHSEYVACNHSYLYYGNDGTLIGDTLPSGWYICDTSPPCGTLAPGQKTNWETYKLLLPS